MKKILLLLAVMAFSFGAFSQVKVGLRVAPGLSLNSVTDKKAGDSTAFSNNGAGFAFSAGVNLDFFFSDNYAFMTGLWYTTKTANLKVVGTNKAFPYTYTQSVALQYLQIPVALKVYTNELATNIKVNFTLGGTIDLKIAEKLAKSNPTNTAYVNSYQPLNVGLLIGSGAEYQTGGNIILFGGLYYNRGLLGQFKNTANFNFKDNAKYTIGSLNLEVGAKF
ncbi:MAG TPA: porin family protein [Cytophagaceae bacterium]|jgi:hypothetical protein|nr:porin family protein [Cytophagaceae bacterium]